MIFQLGYLLPNAQFDYQLAESQREVEHFEDWGFFDNLEINDVYYLAEFLAWLCSHTFANASIIVHLETFLMDVEMAWGKQYNLAVTTLPWPTGPRGVLGLGW